MGDVIARAFAERGNYGAFDCRQLKDQGPDVTQQQVQLLSEQIAGICGGEDGIEEPKLKYKHRALHGKDIVSNLQDQQALRCDLVPRGLPVITAASGPDAHSAWRVAVAEQRTQRITVSNGGGMAKVFTSRELIRNVSTVKRAAEAEPVLITERGRQVYVLLSVEHYQQLAGRRCNIAELLVMPEEVQFEPARLAIRELRIPDFKSDQTEQFRSVV